MSDITQKEQDLLDAFKKEHVNKKGVMSGIEQKVYDVLEKEFEKPGQSGSDKVKAIAQEVENAAVADIINNKNNLSQYIPMGGLVKVANESILKAAEATGGLDGVIRKMLKKQVDADEVEKLALSLDFPKETQSPTPAKTEPTKTTPAAVGGALGDLIKAAAGDDHVLTQPELAALLKNPKFLAAANAVDSMPVTVINKTGQANDEISIGNDGEAIKLSALGISLADYKTPGKPDNVGFKPGVTELKTR